MPIWYYDAMHGLGIFFSILALIFWGVGDFFIQKTSRDYGIWPNTFCITMTGAIVLFPFVYKNIVPIFTHESPWFLLALGVGTLLAGLVTFKALEVGKIAIIEPILSFELPLTVLMVMLLIHENLDSMQMLLVAFVFGGILLVGYTGGLKARHLLEKGVLIALLAALLQAAVNFITGLSSRSIGPVVTIWFVDVFVALVCIIYFTVTQKWHHLLRHIRQHPYESAVVSVVDTAAWVSYSVATVLIPIALAITVSESYIILAIILGVIINREKLLAHQWLGVAVSCASVIVLSAIS